MEEIRIKKWANRQCAQQTEDTERDNASALSKGHCANYLIFDGLHFYVGHWPLGQKYLFRHLETMR